MSGGLLSLAEQKPAVSEKVSTNNIVVTFTRDRNITILWLVHWNWSLIMMWNILSRSNENPMNNINT